MNKIGSQILPISIEDDGQGGQMEDINKKLQEARNKSIIEEAQFTCEPLDICFAVVKTLIMGDITVKQRELNKSILQYFKDQVGKNMVMEHFYPKIEPDYSDPNTKINPKQFLLYGVDYLTTNAIRDRFTIWNYQEKRQINVNQIQWINDSHCKITYSSEKEAEAVLKEQIQTNTKMEDQDGFQKGWLQAKPYTVLFFERPLWIRYSTTDEQSLPKQSVNNFMKFVEAKRMLARFLLQKYNGIEKFQQVVAQIQRKKLYSRPRRIHDNGMNMRDRTRERRRNNYQDRFNQNQRSFRNYSNNRRQNERQQPRQIRTVHYEHQPYRQGQNFRKGQGNRNNSPPNVEYLDYKQTNFNQSDDVNLSFTYKKSQGNNKSFNKNKNNIRKRNCYDSHQINSEYSFNSFGADMINDQSHHYDYIFDQNSKKEKEDLNFSMKYDYKQGSKIDTSFNRYDNKRSFREDLNLSYNNRGHPKDKLDLDISIIVPKDTENNKKGTEDFFEYLNSNISSVRQINQDDFNFNNDSFQCEKGKFDKNKGKSKKDKQQSIYNQDSY